MRAVSEGNTYEVCAQLKLNTNINTNKHKNNIGSLLLVVSGCGPNDFIRNSYISSLCLEAYIIALVSSLSYKVTNIVYWLSKGPLVPAH